MFRLAIITARGGSKRIPKKNIRDFLGRPIISYSITEALNSRLFDEVMVSTDSEEIADISHQFGAQVPFMRSRENSDDLSDTCDVILEVLESYKRVGREFDEFCCIYPTAPFITAEKLRNSHKLLLGDVWNVVPMMQFSFPPQRGMVLKGGFMRPVDPIAIEMRSQDLEPIFHDSGQFYWCKTEYFLKNKSVLSECTVPYLVSELEVQDIDNESDWRLAEIKYQLMQEKK